MVYLGDFSHDQTLTFVFTTVDKTTPGLPITWAGGAADVFPMLTGGPPALLGLTLEVDAFGPGCHLVTIDLAAALVNRVDGQDYVILATGGTVDGVDITGYALAQFSVRNRPVDGTSLRGGLGIATANLDVQLGAIDAKTANLPEGVRKAQPFANFDFFLVLSSDGRSGAEGKAVLAERRLDGGAWAPCSNPVTEVELGLYTIDLDAADTSADALTLRFSADGCDPTIVTIKTSLT